MAILVARRVNGQPPDADAEKKLKDTFGPDSEIVRDAKFKFELVLDKVILVFACKEIKVVPNNKILLTPGHYACFVKEEGSKKFTPSSIGRAPSVELMFDRPVKTIEEMQKARLESASWPKVLTRGLKR